jgi:cytosine/adenosine deaminase-related metal-dependent hydrolase
MGSVSAPRRRRHSNFDVAAKRRREIVLHGRHVGAAETEDFSQWLIAWHWHNSKARDPIWSLMEAAKKMGGKITEAEASAITKEASITRKHHHLSADNLARFLGVTYAQRQALRLTTIGSVNVGKRARTVLRKRRACLREERRRRATGAIPRAEYEAKSLSATKPWKELGISRRTWERRRNKARDASPCAANFLI